MATYETTTITMLVATTIKTTTTASQTEPAEGTMRERQLHCDLYARRHEISDRAKTSAGTA